MKKTLCATFLFIAFVNILQAQVSFNNNKQKPKYFTNNKEFVVLKQSKEFEKNVIINNKEFKKIIYKIDSTTQDTIAKILLLASAKRNLIILSDTIANKDSVIKRLNTDLDSMVGYQKEKLRLVKYWYRYYRAEDKENKFFNFLPAYYASQSKYFFEGDSTHKKFFANNIVNYSPISKKMAVYTEVVNDYFGPFRFDIGFTLRSKSSTDSTNNADSAKAINKKENLITALQNGGGDVSFNLKFPLLARIDNDRLFNFKAYTYFNVGFALPVINEATNNFFANYDFGVDAVLFAKGFDKKITFFGQTKTAYYFGNRAFRNIIKAVNDKDPSSFFLGQASLGLDFLDGFRFKVDFYYGNSFVKENFPATVTFIVRPGFNK